ncbi:hypothetical protein NG895_12275 [Aeoliella sp. ICT_H6.2]|uniref:Uncharacterized protein n=1 Tax=Aeoliella straminimaris TaxID=2954799 RepID=A0A9X2F9A7_9BACT|nr:hypothetical protein [Aeoliella straminimaris]MCO6044685.1 hypothetical protein [Aeoliella straminimaris]
MLFRFRELGILDEDRYDALLQATRGELSQEREHESVKVPTTDSPLQSERLVEVPLIRDEPATAPASPTAPIEVTSNEPATIDQAANLPAPAPSAGLSVGTRAERYAVSRHAAAEVAATAPPPPPKPKRDWGKLFQAFLEKNNIMLGELVGGLLIVTCSIALVISFWAEIASRPLLKFGIFNGVSAALFAAGFYTDRRWKIHTTSHGVLIIAILLVPLNFLAIAAFTASSPPTDLLSLVGEALSLVAFSALTYFAARTVTPQSPLALTLCIMICSLMQLLIRRFAGPDSSLGVLYLLAVVPVGSFALAVLCSVRQSLRGDTSKAEDVVPHFTVLGVGLFATLLPLALLLFRGAEVTGLLQQLSPLLVVLAGPALATAILLWPRLDTEVPALRVAAGSVGALGGVMLLASVRLAWPLPFALIATALANCVLWAVLAWCARIPRLNVLAAVFMTLAWLIGAAIVDQQVSWNVADAQAITNSIFSALGGQRMLPVVAVCCVLGAVCRWMGAKATAIEWGASAATATLVSFLLLMIFGFGRVGDPANTVWYFVFYAVLATTAAWIFDSLPLTRAAVTFVLVAFVQSTVFRYGEGWHDTRAWILAMLLFGTLNIIVSSTAMLWQPVRTKTLRSGFATAGLAAGIVAAALLLFLGWRLDYDSIAIGVAWLALLWLALAWLLRESQLFVAFQVSLAVAVGVMVTSYLAKQSWYAEESTPWFDPWFWQAQGIALAASATIWKTLRIVISRLPQVSRNALNADVSRPPWATFDRFAGGLLFTLTILLASYAVYPGMAQELSPSVEAGARVPVPLSVLELPSVSSHHAGGWGSWLLLTATGVLVGLGCWDRRPSLHIVALYVLGAAACLLGASLFAQQTAAASALRWLLGIYTLLAAITIAARRHLRPRLAAVGVEIDTPPPHFLGASLSQASRTIVVALVAGLYLAIAGFVITSSFRSGPLTPGADRMLLWSGVLAAVGAIVWLVMTLPAVRKNNPSEVEKATYSGVTRIGRHLIGLCLVLPLLIVFAYILASKLTQHPLIGPDPKSWFGDLGNSLLYGGPLAMFAVVLLVFAIREASSRFAFSFGLLVASVATLVYLLELAAAGRSLDAVAWITLAQLNAATMAVVAIGWWLAMVWRYDRHTDTRRNPLLLQVLAGLAVTFSAETLLAGCWGVFVSPTNLTWQASVANTLGLVSVSLATIALWLTTKPSKVAFTTMHVAALSLLVVTLLTNAAVKIDTGNWEAFHTMLVMSAAASWALVVLPTPWRTPLWSTLFAGVTTVISIRELVPGAVTPQWPWWSLFGLVSVYGVLLRIAWVRTARWPIWLASPALAIAAHAWWWNLMPQRGAQVEINFLDLTAIVLAIASIGSVLVELRFTSRLASDPSPRWRLIGFHRFAVWLAIAVVLLGVAIELSKVGSTPGLGTYWWLGLLAIVSVLCAIFTTLWDPCIRWPIVAFYTLSLAAVGKFLGILSLEGDDFTWALAMALGAFVLATSYLWQRRQAIAEFAIRLGAPAHLRERLHSQMWILSANGLAILVVLALVVQIEFTHTMFSQRMTAAYSVLACAVGLAFLAAGRVEPPLRYLAIAMGALFAVAFAWAWIPPGLEVANLHRLVAAGVAIAAMVPLYGTLLVKIWRRSNPWVEAAQASILTLVAVAGVLLVVTLASEVSFFVHGKDAPLVWPAVLAVALAVMALAVSSLAAALIPGRDPLNLSERGRTAYVYAAEAFVGLLFVHIRVTMPWLFASWFAQYWPFVVMFLAFAGVGLSEWFARRQTKVLAEPLNNTGLLLPLLPVIGFWSSGQAGQYSVLLIAVGLLYTTMALMRKAPVLMGLALLAFNGSLWTMLNSVEGLGLLRHPQFWLIPPILCVLIGAELSRRHLSASTLSTVRYICAVMIYASSTADIFINGVGAGLWLPLVLAALSLAGVFAGILLRVRAFLFLGIAFLCVSLFSVVWHAAVELERTWIWWVAGILTGTAIIVLFGLFEKKREQALVLVEQMKRWEP